MASERRRGAEGAATRLALLDAAESLIREQGHPAVTARTLADRLSLKRQIVHYYFETMDDVFVALVRRNSDRLDVQLQAALLAPEPLRELWRINSDPDQSLLAAELLALANHRPAIREEVRHAAQRARTRQCEVLSEHLRRRDIAPVLPPVLATLLLTSLSQGLTLERGVGFVDGHPEALHFVDDCLSAFAQNRAPALPPFSDLVGRQGETPAS